jgi:hypothetical protein
MATQIVRYCDFSLITPFPSINKTGRHDTTEILLENTIEYVRLKEHKKKGL